MKTEIRNDYLICLDNSDNIIEEYSNYAEMIIHLFQLHSENPKADYFVKWYKDERTWQDIGEYHFVERERGTYELDILGKYQIKEEVTA